MLLCMQYHKQQVVGQSLDLHLAETLLLSSGFESSPKSKDLQAPLRGSGYYFIRHLLVVLYRANFKVKLYWRHRTREQALVTKKKALPFWQRTEVSKMLAQNI